MVEIKGHLNSLRQEKPLIHHITNVVTVSECANVTLCVGALPVMAYDKEEVGQMVQAASALVLNIGTLTTTEVESMLVAGEKANSLGIPIVFDPVGVGATDLRNRSAARLLKEIEVSFIKGNEAEINILAGHEGKIKGVESVGSYENTKDAAKELAKKQDSVVVVSGQEDIITNGEKVFVVRNGHYLMGKVVGTGCMAASMIACFAAVGKNKLESALVGMLSLGIAGEIAAQNISSKGPGHFKCALYDAIHDLEEETIYRNQNFEEISF